MSTVEVRLSKAQIPAVVQLGQVYFEKNALVATLHRWINEAKEQGAATDLLHFVTMLLDGSEKAQ